MLWNDVRSEHLIYSLVAVWAQSNSHDRCKILINVNLDVQVLMQITLI